MGLRGGQLRIGDLTMPRDGVKKEVRCFTDWEMQQIIANAPEPLRTIAAITAVLGLRIGETLALRVSDLDFAKRIIGVRQSVDAATRTIGGTKSAASSADLPMPKQLEEGLRSYQAKHGGKSELLFVNQRGRPYSANKLRADVLHPLLKRSGIPRGGWHAMRHGAASSLLADGATPAVVQRQLRHQCKDHVGALLARHRRRAACSRRKSVCTARRIAAIVRKPHSVRNRETKSNQINWFGGDGGSPTRDLGVRSASLYASELRPRPFLPHYNGKPAPIFAG